MTTETKDTWPSDDGGTKRQWQARKRRELDAVIKAMQALNMASCYLPDGGFVLNTLIRLQELRECLQVKRWR